jgi:hemoglobin-like flavoprotein
MVPTARAFSPIDTHAVACTQLYCLTTAAATASTAVATLLSQTTVVKKIDYGHVVCRCAPGLYKLLHKHLFSLLLLRPFEKVRCPMVTVSQLIDEYGIK